MTCVCGDPGSVHEHYRAGTDCALCSCRKFRRRRRGFLPVVVAVVVALVLILVFVSVAT